MKALKIILSAILFFAFIKGCNDLTVEEPRSAGMYTGITVVFLLIPCYLIYSAFTTKKPDPKNESKELDKF